MMEGKRQMAGEKLECYLLHRTHDSPAPHVMDVDRLPFVVSYPEYVYSTIDVDGGCRICAIISHPLTTPVLQVVISGQEMEKALKTCGLPSPGRSEYDRLLRGLFELSRTGNSALTMTYLAFSSF